MAEHSELSTTFAAQILRQREAAVFPATRFARALWEELHGLMKRTHTMTRRHKTWSIAALVMCATIPVACGNSSSGTATAKADAPIALDAVNAADSGGAKTLTIGGKRAKPMVVNLWATWCTPCRKELPDFQKVATDVATTVDVVGVNMGEEASQIKPFLDELKITFPQYLDPTSAVQSRFEVTGLPATVFIRTDGTVAEVYKGALNAETLTKKIADNLGK